MRQTYCVPAAYSHSSLYQPKLDAMWNLIEDMYEDDWRVDHNGDLLFVLDEAMIERVFSDNIATAWYTFGAYKGGYKDDKRFFLSRPDFLLGTYIIKGVYTHNLHLITRENQKREYFFVQEGF